jgi:hypothetical protein
MNGVALVLGLCGLVVLILGLGGIERQLKRIADRLEQRDK